MNWGTIKKTGAFLMGEWDASFSRTISRLDDEGIIDFHNRTLENVVTTAYEKTPYYRDLFDQASINVKDFEAKDLEKLPLLTKTIILKEGPRLLANDYQERGPFHRYSGGSTGEPVRIVQDRYFKMRTNAIFQLYYRDFLGIDELAARKLVVWGTERDIYGEKKGVGPKLRNRLSRNTILNSFRMSEEDIANYVQKINQVQPELIRSYAGTLYQISRYINRTGFEVHRPKAIVSTAEMLRPIMRQEIETAFKTKLYDYYGSREVGGIAGECEHHSLHHILLQNHVEVLDSNNRPVAPGEEGRVVVTNLNNFSMPLIRFEVGDTAVLGSGKCKCGSILPHLDHVTGRINDHFVLRNGTVIGGCYFTHLIFDRDWARSFRIIQEDYERVVIKVVPLVQPKESDIEDIERKLRIVMGPKCTIEWEFVDKIDVPESGKHQYIKTMVGPGSSKAF